MVLAPASSSVSARGSDQTHAASGGSAGMQPPAGSASSQSAAEVRPGPRWQAVASFGLPQSPAPVLTALTPPPPTAPAGRLPLSQPVLEWLEAANPLNLFPCLGPPQREFAGESLISREPAAEGSRRGVAPILSRQASSSVLPRSEGLTATSHCERGGCDAAAD
jgi:hypothetical protein